MLGMTLKDRLQRHWWEWRVVYLVIAASAIGWYVNRWASGG